jgi:hypothetical protein
MTTELRTGQFHNFHFSRYIVYPLKPRGNYMHQLL